MRRPPTTFEFDTSSRPQFKPEPTSASHRMTPDEMGGILVKPRKNPNRKNSYKRILQQSIVDANVRVGDRANPKQWYGVDANTLVGLYASAHQTIYKVEAAELEDDFLKARAMAQRCIKELGDSPETVVKMIQWKMADAKRQVQNSDFRLTWNLLFHKKTVVSFKAARLK